MWLGIQRRGSLQPAPLAVSIPFSFTGTSVLQCVAVCCSVLPCVAVASQPAPLAISTPFSFTGTSVLQCIAVCCSALQFVAVCCSVIAASPCLWPQAHPILIHRYECAEMFVAVLQCVTVCCSVLQCVAVCCSVLQWHRSLRLSPQAPHSHSQVRVYRSVLQRVAICCSVCCDVCGAVYTCVSLPAYVSSYLSAVCCSVL